MHLRYYDDSYDEFLKWLPGPRVLDVCCGPGNISLYLKSKDPSLKVTGVDYAPGMIDQFKQHLPEDQVYCGDFLEFESGEEQFDGLICGFGIPFVADSELPGWLGHSNKLLNTGGIMYLSFVEGETHQSGFKIGSTGLRVYFHYHRVQMLIQILQQSGFLLLASFEVPHPGSQEMHQVLLLKKMV